MKAMKFPLVLAFFIFFALSSGVRESSLAMPVSCPQIFTLSQSEREWRQLSQKEKTKRRLLEMKTPSPPGIIERRPLQKTSGHRHDVVVDMDPADFKIDSADPSLVMPITYPNGITKFRINFSGMRFVEASTPAELFSNALMKVSRSRGFYKDGTEMTGAYHNEAWPWDVVIYKSDQGEWIALGGVMEQAKPGRLPNVREHNRSRSRWWGKVLHIEIEKGVFEERIIWQEPIHDFNRNRHQSWEFHGYGGTLVTEFNPKTGVHEPIKNKNGNYTLMYERVTEEKEGQPWVTTTFLREMHPSLKFTLGPEISITNIFSPTTGQIFEAFRRGDENHTTGYLREGDNVLKELKHQQYLKAGSGNDYVRKYGIYLDYREPGQELFGPFKNVIDSQGQLIDFATTLKLRELFNGTWLGRPQLNYDPQGKLWLSFHFVPKDSIPRGAPVEGWPSGEDFPHYGRVTAMVPVQIVHDQKSQPHLVLDIDPQWAYKYQIDSKPHRRGN